MLLESFFFYILFHISSFSSPSPLLLLKYEEKEVRFHFNTMVLRTDCVLGANLTGT